LFIYRFDKLVNFDILKFNFHMNKVFLITISIILFFSQSFSQNLTPRDSSLLKIEANYKSLSEKLNEIEKTANKAQTESNNLSTVADLIISWSVYIFTIFSILLAFASVYTGFQINNIRKAKEEFTSLISDMKSKFKKQAKGFDELKMQFEKEKEKSLKLLFPLIEGQIHFINGNYERALKMYTEADFIEPNHPRILKHLYWLIANTGRLEEAILKLEKLNKEIPNDKIVKSRLAEAYRRNKNYDKAELIVKDLALIDKYPHGIYEYGAILQRKKNYVDAEKYFIESNKYFLMEDGIERFWVYLSIALTQLVNNKSHESLENAQKSVTLSKENLTKRPNNPHCFISLCIGQILVNIDDIEAEISLQKAIANALPIELAKSAIEKLNLIEGNKKSKVLNKLKITLNQYISGK
jgi:tetratricopeptide (TPR) repeat protein